MWVSFNQDGSCLILGTSNGFRVYNCIPFGKFYTSDDGVGVGCAEMLFSTSIVAMSGSGEHDSPRKLRIVNTRKPSAESVLCELTFPTTVRRIRMNRQRLAVVLDTQVYVYDVSNMRLLTVIETIENKLGLVSITSDIQPGSSVIVYPASSVLEHSVASNHKRSQTSGDVAIFDCESNSLKSTVHAHKSRLAALVLSADGSLMATASHRGTIIRVFSLPSGRLLHELRRGSSPTQIYSIAFNYGAKLLCVSSANMTVHIYKLDEDDAAKSKSKSWLSKAPETGTRSYAYFKLPLAHGTRTVLAMAPLSNVVLVAAETGVLFQYMVDIDKGGECRKIGEFAL